jgi:hypothetical protein
MQPTKMDVTASLDKVATVNHSKRWLTEAYILFSTYMWHKKEGRKE